MTPGHIAAAVLALVIAFVAYRRRARLSGELKVMAIVVVVGLAVFASGLLSNLPSLESIIKDLADALGKGTYVLVGAMAFLETGAFVGFIAPGEFTVILGGVIAGEGTISIIPLIGIVWFCAIAGDSTSFLIGHKVGRQFMLKHGPRVRITEERFHQVEDYFDKHGGKTIVIGRFLGFVRPLAPFIAGTSRMTYGRFIPYSIVGTGLWGTTFCLLGYIFWRSFDKVSKIAGRATLALGILALVVGSIVYARHRLKDPAERERFERWMNSHRVTRWGWRWFVRPIVRVAWPQIRFLWDRVTPGHLGLEFTTTMAVLAAGAFTFIFYASALRDDPNQVFPLDNTAVDIANRFDSDRLISITKVVTSIGAFPVVVSCVLIASALLVRRRRLLEMFTLAAGYGLVVLLVHVAKDSIARPRPPDPVSQTFGLSYPSGHSAYATTYVVLAVILTRVFSGIASRTAVVLTGIAIALVVGATRIYLRAHYLSDVIGGYGLGLAIYAGIAAILLVVSFIRQNAKAAAGSPQA